MKQSKQKTKGQELKELCEDNSQAICSKVKDTSEDLKEQQQDLQKSLDISQMSSKSK